VALLEDQITSVNEVFHLQNAGELAEAEKVYLPQPEPVRLAEEYSLREG
jgi:hypothetical protein